MTAIPSGLEFLYHERNKEGVRLDMAEADYHDLRRVSASGLEWFRRDPAGFGRWLAGGESTRAEPTRNMQLGSMLHALLLDGLPEYDARYTVSAPVDRRTKAGQDYWARLNEDAGLVGKTVVRQEDDALVQEMAIAVRQSPHGWLLELPGAGEVTLLYDLTGLPCKSRLDRLFMLPTRTDEQLCILDVKTMDDPTPSSFAFNVLRYGYHRQAAMYQHALYRATGREAVFRWLVVGRDRPHRVMLATPDAGAQSRGLVEVHAAVEAVAEAKRKDRWVGSVDAMTIYISLPERGRTFACVDGDTGETHYVEG